MHGQNDFVACQLMLPDAAQWPIPHDPVQLLSVTHCDGGPSDPRCPGDDIVRLDHASQLLCLPDDTTTEPHLAPDGSVVWQATIAARVEALHRLALQAGDRLATDPFGVGSFRHATLLMLLGSCVDAPEPATLELGLLSELLQAAVTTENDRAACADFVVEGRQMHAVEAFVAHLREGETHLGAATMFGALVPSWRIDSHVVPAIRRWVWCCTTPLAAAQLRPALAAASEMFNECAVLLGRIGDHSTSARRDAVMSVAMNVASIWSLQWLHGLRRRRLGISACRPDGAGASDSQFDSAWRRELASCTVTALRAVTRLDVDTPLQRAVRVFCARQYDVAARSMAEPPHLSSSSEPSASRADSGPFDAQGAARQWTDPR